MKILVTGARGFIGQWVCKSLNKRGVEWAVFKGDVLRGEDFALHDDCDTIIHLAAKVRAAGALEHMIRVNTEGTLNVLRFVSARQRRIIFASSYLYGTPREQPIKEAHPTTYDNAYSFSKWLAEQAIIGQSLHLGIRGVVVRIFNAYGPGQKTGFLIPDIFEGVRRGRLMLRSVSPRRDFIFVEDLAELIVSAATVPVGGLEIVNAGSGTSHSVMDAVNTVFDITRRRVPVENDDQPVLIPNTIADISRAGELYGWRPETMLEKGLFRVAAGLGLLPEQGGLNAGSAIVRLPRQ